VSHAAAAAVDQYLLQACAKPQQQTRWPQLSINGTDRWTDTQPFYDGYHIPCRPRNNHTQTENIITALVTAMIACLYVYSCYAMKLNSTTDMHAY